MNINTARWLMIKRLSADEIRRLHGVEKKSDAEWQENQKLDKPKQNVSYWREAGLMEFSSMNISKPKFWPRSLSEEDRAREVERFERHIFTLWKPRMDRYEHGDVSEIQAVHDCDLAIKADPYKPAFEPVPMGQADYAEMAAGDYP